MAITAALLAQSLLLIATADEFQIRVNLVLQALLLVIFGAWTRRATGSYLSAPFIIAASIYAWHSTFVTGHLFEVAAIFSDTGRVFAYGRDQLPRGIALVALSSSLFVTGTLAAAFSYGTRERGRAARHAKPAAGFADFDSKVVKAIWILLSALSVLLLVYIAVEGKNTFDRGYLSLYSEESASLLYRIFYSSQYLWVLAVILAVVANRNQPRRLKIVIGWSIAAVILLAMLGSRSAPFICLCALVLSLDCFVKRWSLAAVAGFLIFLSALSFVMDQSRSNRLGLGVFDFGSVGKDVDVVHFFYQNGMIIRNVIRTMEFAEDDGLLYGQSYLEPVLYVVPRPILETIGIRVRLVRPSEWLAQRSPDVEMYSGLGYSAVAEAYFNFGMLGCLLFLPAGYYVASRQFHFSWSGAVLDGVGAIAIAALAALHMRNDSGSYLRVLIWCLVVIWAFGQVVRSRRRPAKAAAFSALPRLAANRLHTHA